LQILFGRGVNQCLTGMRIDVVAAVAACVMFCGGIVATLVFSNPRRLCIPVNVRHLVAGVRYHACFEDLLKPSKRCCRAARSVKGSGGERGSRKPGGCISAVKGRSASVPCHYDALTCRHTQQSSSVAWCRSSHCCSDDACGMWWCRTGSTVVAAWREAGLPSAFCLALSVRATTNH
jgi:hypothetical protein